MSAVIGSKKINFSEEQGMLLDVAREFVKDKSPGSEVRKFLESEQDSYCPNSHWRYEHHSDCYDCLCSR